MRYVLTSTEDDSTKCIDVPDEMIKKSKSIKGQKKIKVQKIKVQKIKGQKIKNPVKRLQSSKPILDYKKKKKQ